MSDHLPVAAATANVPGADRIPLIDIGPLRDGSDPDSVAVALHRASRDLGFIYVCNHGIPEELIAAARTVAMEFFRQPLGCKLEVKISDRHRGFLKIGDARMQDDLLPDLKESFIWSLEYDDGRLPDNHALRGANRWPASLPHLRTVAMEYFAAAQVVAETLLRGFARGLALPDNFFLRNADRPLSRASFTYYPPQLERESGCRFGVGPHTDFGLLTVLCQDEVGGLEVQGLDGAWIAAPPISGSLVVNVGDLLARWTNGRYRSTPHRVINQSGRERLSLVFAYDPNPETIIDPRESGALDSRIEPITCGDYLSWRFAKSFDYRRRRP